MTLKQNQRAWYLGLLTMIVGGITLIILTTLSDHLLFFVTPTDIFTKNIQLNTAVRLGGLVEKGSIQKKTDGEINFVVTDLKHSLFVRYRGLLPDLFREDQGVVVEGRLTSPTHFVATKLLAKHDENYMPKDVADALKKSGQWKPEEKLRNG